MSDNEVITETQPQKYDLSKFQLTKVLTNNTNRKTICILGNFNNITEDKNKALIIFEKNAFTEDALTLNDGYLSDKTKLTVEFINDIYGNFLCYPNPDINNIKTTIICPATDKHIEKYSSHPIHIIEETPALYKDVVLPHIESEHFSLQWVYNILEHKQESERIVFEDKCEKNGFILLPDLKWDGKTLETLYCVAIIHQKNIKSLRDLSVEHLPLLRNIYECGVEAIETKYNIKKSQLRIYVHYQPSFYHFHVHFTYLKHDAPGIFCEKSHLLTTIITNIELLSDYYQRANLSFVIKETDRLYENIKKYENAIE